MSIDIAKLISGNPQHNGGAVTSPLSSLFTINSVHYGNDFDIDAYGARVAKKWKIRGYYYSNSPYNSDVTSDSVTGTAGADTLVTYSADAYGTDVINGVGWSYSGGSPTSGNISVESPSGVGNTLYSQYITGSGQGYINFPDPIRGAFGSGMNVRLKAGGSGIVGVLDVFGHRIE